MKNFSLEIIAEILKQSNYLKEICVSDPKENVLISPLVPQFDFVSGDSVNQNIKYVITDSRKIENVNPQDYDSVLFIALTGEKFDGSDFIVPLINKGVRVFICSFDKKEKILFDLKKHFEKHCDKEFFKKLNIFFVKDTTNAYGKLAKWKLAQYEGIKIAITGSAGKTSLKELLGKLLSLEHRTFVSEKNTNNLIGVPQNIFSITHSHDYYVFELGMNHAGEIAQLSDIVQPNIAVVTNVLPSHIGYFKTIKDIARAKAEIFLYMSSKDKGLKKKKTTFLNLDNDYFSFLTKKAKQNQISVIPFSPCKLKKETWINVDFQLITQLHFKNRKYLYLGGDTFILEHLSCLLKISSFLNISDSTLEVFFSQLSKTQSVRSEEKNYNPKIIDDAYNANPFSMVQAVRHWKNIIELTYNKTNTSLLTLFVLGDIFELGKKSKKYHQKIAKEIYKVFKKTSSEIKENVHFVFFGKEMYFGYKCFDFKNKKYFEDKDKMLGYLKQVILNDDTMGDRSDSFFDLSSNTEKETTHHIDEELDDLKEGDFEKSKKLFFFKASNGMQLQRVIDELVSFCKS